MYLPQVFLAGAPKSGTTYLFDRLMHHPEIVGPRIKETYFYMDRDSPYIDTHNNYHLSDRQYHKKFDIDPSKVCIDGTTHTMYQTGFASFCSKLDLKPKFIFLLRNPSERILSSFQYTSQNLSAVKNISFEEYVKYLLAKNSEGLRKHCRDERSFYSLSNELGFSEYVKYLDVWKKAIGKENMLIVTSESFWRNQLSILNKIARFIGLNPFEDEEYTKNKSNESYEVRNASLHFAIRKLIKIFGLKPPEMLIKSYKKLFTEPLTSESKDLTLLKSYFQPFNIELSRKYGVEVHNWEE